MKTLVIDDDPTGTQSASDVTVLLEWDAKAIWSVLESEDAVYLLTNSRAVDETTATALLRRTRAAIDDVAARLGEPVRVLLRGDSTLRGHVFAEIEIFSSPTSRVLFVPAFPEGGRVTIEGTHYVEIGGSRVAAHETEYAGDPVFGYDSGFLPDYVREKSPRKPWQVGVGLVRADLGSLVDAFSSAPPGSVILPDVHSGEDIVRIAAAVRECWSRGLELVVRSGSPLAAEIAGVGSRHLLDDISVPGPSLVVCGSHTEGARQQLADVLNGRAPLVINTDAALENSAREKERLAAEAWETILEGRVAVVASERDRRPEHDTLLHGEQVMDVLVHVVQRLRTTVSSVVSKGGITSAEVAHRGLGAASARVLGQVLPGVSVWELNTPERRKVRLVVVPGNVGDRQTISRSLRELRGRAKVSG